MKILKEIKISEMVWETAKQDAKDAGKNINEWIELAIWHAHICDAAGE